LDLRATRASCGAPAVKAFSAGCTADISVEAAGNAAAFFPASKFIRRNTFLPRRRRGFQEQCASANELATYGKLGGATCLASTVAL
jgi:hypothetical protein